MYIYDIEPFLKKAISGNNNQINDVKIKKMTLLTTDISESEIEDSIVEIQKKAKGLNIDIGITANDVILVKMDKCLKSLKPTADHLRI